MCAFQEFLLCVHKYLVGKGDCNNNLIRKHTRNLEKEGELSFSVSTVSFCTSSATIGILRDEASDVTLIEELIRTESRNWPLHISKCTKIGDSIHMFADRLATFEFVIRDVLQQKTDYGSQQLDYPQNINVTIEFEDQDLNVLSLSQLRAILLKDVTTRILNFCKSHRPNRDIMDVKLSLRSNTRSEERLLFCGPVLTTKRTKNCTTNAQEFYNKRTVDMRLMAQHKYGMRIKSDSGWQEIFEKLGHAAVTIDLLQNRHNRAVTINTSDYTCSSSKGASFILYNCARLAALFKDFEKKVEQNVYPALPDILNVDFNLLTQPEEWELLYSYVLQFPYVIKDSIKDILNGRVNVHNLCNMLSSMCLIFSIYYRRVRVLTEPRSHLHSTLHARIYLLKVIEQVLHTGLYVLNIQPVRQM